MIRARAVLLAACLLITGPARSCPLTPATGFELAFPVRSDQAGRPPRATLVLTRPAGSEWGWSSGVLDLGHDRCIQVPGPDEPAAFFLLIVKAVLFRPHSSGARPGFAILYDSGQIGPMHGFEHRAMFYRVGPGSIMREPGLERRLDQLSRPNDSDFKRRRNAARVLAGSR